MIIIITLVIITITIYNAENAAANAALRAGRCLSGISTGSFQKAKKYNSLGFGGMKRPFGYDPV